MGVTKSLPTAPPSHQNWPTLQDFLQRDHNKDPNKTGGYRVQVFSEIHLHRHLLLLVAAQGTDGPSAEVVRPWLNRAALDPLYAYIAFMCACMCIYVYIYIYKDKALLGRSKLFICFLLRLCWEGIWLAGDAASSMLSWSEKVRVRDLKKMTGNFLSLKC